MNKKNIKKTSNAKTSLSKTYYKKFPHAAAILLASGMIWLLNDLDIVELPWIPIIVMIVAIGMIINHYTQ